MSNEFSYYIDVLITQLKTFQQQIDSCEDNEDRACFLRERQRLFTEFVKDKTDESTRLKKLTHLKALIDLLLHMYDNKLFDCCDVLNKLNIEY